MSGTLPAAAARESFPIGAIGTVESPFRAVSDRCDYTTPAQVRLWPELADGLLGIEYFSHLWVVYYQHCAKEWMRFRQWEETRPLVLPADDDRAGQGIFSSRAPCRPARLGSCIVELVRREGSVLFVRGLDAIDGTPVLDVKPYVPQFDAFPQATVPLCWAKVMARSDDASHGSRTFHWDTTQVDFALGQRLGLAVLQAGNVARGALPPVTVRGSTFLAQGFEMTTGCSPLRGTLTLIECSAHEPWWGVSLADVGTFVLRNLHWPDAAAVFAAKDDELWTRSAS